MGAAFCAQPGEAVTLYGLRRSRATGTNAWHTVHIACATWAGARGARVQKGGLSAAGHCTVRLPEAALPGGYLPPAAFGALADAAGHWTIQNGDVMARGTLPAASENPRALLAGQAHFVVTGVRDNRRGVPLLRHLKVTGK